MTGDHTEPRDTAHDDRQRRIRRRAALPLCTLLVAAAILGWHRWTAPRHLDEVRMIVTSLVSDAAPPAPSRAAIPGTDPIITPLVRTALAAARAESELRSLRVTVDVLAGEHADGDGNATHHAIVLVGDEPRVLLRVVHGGRSGVAIIGVGALREQRD